MQINQITVSFTRTQSLPSYSNVKPGVTLTATLEEGDDPIVAYGVLMHDARRLVHDEIDGALELAGQSPIFTSAPLYWSAFNKALKAVVILPESTEPAQLHKLVRDDPNFNWRADWHTSHTLQHREAVIAGTVKDQADYTFIDCSDGDLSRIPPLPLPLAVPPSESSAVDSDDDDRPENERFPDWDEEEETWDEEE